MVSVRARACVLVRFVVQAVRVRLSVRLSLSVPGSSVYLRRACPRRILSVLVRAFPPPWSAVLACRSSWRPPMGTSMLTWVQLSCALCLGASAAAAAFEPATSARSSCRHALPRAVATSRAPPLLPRALTPRTVALRMEVEVAPADRGLLDGYAASSHRWPSIWDGKPYAAAVVPPAHPMHAHPNHHARPTLHAHPSQPVQGRLTLARCRRPRVERRWSQVPPACSSPSPC